ncbi:MAG: FixH family protein [Pseudomonadota bacterium]|nr:FixH family protein [Pseudomonadota bacterium]
MAHSAIGESGPRLTGRKVLLILLSFFGVVFAVNGLMAYDALSTLSGEVDAHPYEDGLAYNGQIAAAQAQAQRGWKVDVQLDPAGPRAAFRDAAGRPVEGLSVTGRWDAPADMKRDHTFAMRADGPGVYVAPGATAAAGAWDLELVARRDGQTLFRSLNRVTLR